MTTLLDRRLLGVILILFTAAAGVAYLGTRGGEQPVAGIDPAPIAAVSFSPPLDEPIPPVGPHRQVFQASCTICHSTRLILTQPNLNERQWMAVVDKMVKAYGAPLNEEQQRQVLTYLNSIGTESRQLAAK
ncbi:MAG: hypothetical protein K2R98_26380 [Gemmataceae bacterium]|nr:hypothetical protein [Gemmataceae bacterium]